MDKDFRKMVEPAWRRLIHTYGGDPLPRFYSARRDRSAAPRLAYLWGFGAVLAAAGAVCAVPGGQTLVAGDLPFLTQTLATYRRPLRRGLSSTARGSDRFPGDAFYDDNAWVGLAAQDLSADFAEWRLTAENAYRFVLEGFDRRSGGVFWKERPKSSLHVCSTGPALVLGARLALAAVPDVRREPLAAMLAWLRAMQAPDGRYWDHREGADGRIDRAFYTYNSGTPLQAMAILHTMGGFDVEHDVRRALDGVSRFLDDQGHLPPTPWFNAVLLRGLLAVQAVFGWESAATSAMGHALAEAARGFVAGSEPLMLFQDRRAEGPSLREAAASVEILARLAAGDGG